VSIRHWIVELRSFFGIAAFAALIVGGAPSSAAAQTTSPGFTLDELSIAPPGAFIGGFEVLPNGNYALFDGAAVVELSSADGSQVRTLFTPASFVFGAFLTLSPDGKKLYFGESSNGYVHEIDLATLSSTIVLDTVYPYDLAFDPQGRPFLSYALGFFSGSYVALCDFTNGTLDDVIVSPDASGPLAFDAAGNLYFATPDLSSYPPPPDGTEVLRFDPGDVTAGIGPATIGVNQGELLGLVDGAAYLALDESGDVLVSDPNSGVLVELDPLTLDERVVAQAGPYVSFLYLRESRGARGAFEPWQPADAGELLAIRSDFFSLNGLTRVRPQRPTLTTNPASSIPPGRYEVAVTGAVPSGLGLLLVTGGIASSERELKNRTWPAPLFIGLDFTGGVSVSLFSTDPAGEWRELLNNPGSGGITLAAQVVVGPGPSDPSGARPGFARPRSLGPLFGTSAPLQVILQ